AAGDQAALDEKMRIVPHDLAIFAGAGLRLVGIDHEIMRTAIGLLGHERPFQSGRESRATAPALPRRLDFIDDGIATARQNIFGAVPGAAAARAVEAPIVLAVEILEDAVLVGEHQLRLGSVASPFGGSVSVVGPPIGAELMRSICGPGFGIRPAERSLMIRVNN